MAKRHVLMVNKEEIEVTEEVYRAYKRSVWNENKRTRYRLKVERSLEKFFEQGFDFASDNLVEEIVDDQILLETLLESLRMLTDEERALIDALFYQGRTGKEMAEAYGITPAAIHYRKTRILDKLKKIICDG